MKKIVGIPFGYRGFSEKDLAEMPVSYINSSSLPKCSLNFQVMLFGIKCKSLTLISKPSLLMRCYSTIDRFLFNEVMCFSDSFPAALFLVIQESGAKYSSFWGKLAGGITWRT